MHIVAVGRAYGVIQGQENPDETPLEALARTEDAILAEVQRKTLQMEKREKAQADTNANVYITKL